MKKRVAIVMSTYNPELPYLEAQIESLLSQDLGVDNFDILIRDDGSSKEELAPYLKSLQINHPNIFVIRGENVGVFDSFWILINEAYNRGYEFVSLSDQDDIAMNNKLSHAISFLEKENMKMPLLFFSQMTYVNERLEELGYPYINQSVLGLKNALYESSVNGNLMVFNRMACELVISQKPKSFYMHDWWIYLCVSAFGKVIYSPVSTLLYRQHSNNVIGGSQSFFDVMKRRINRFRDYSEKTYPVYKQGKEFMTLFGSQLDESALVLLNKLLASKESFINRICFAMSYSNFARMKFIDNVLLRFLILMNKY